MNFIHPSPGILPLLVIVIFCFTVASGCIQQGIYSKNSSQQYSDVQDSSFFVKTSENLLKFHIFDGTLVENIISPDIFTEIGQYPLINYELSRISLPFEKENPVHLLTDTSETVYIISGEAQADINGISFSLSEGDSLFIPKNAVQSIKNTGEEDLSYLSITYPPYKNINEVIISDNLNETIHYSEEVVFRSINGSEKQIFFTDVEIIKIFDPEILKNSGINSEFAIGIAKAKIPEGSQTDPHILEGTTEVMYFLEGEGFLQVNRKIMSVKAGDTAYIPPGAYQSLLNSGDGDLAYITITDPAYSESADSSAD